MNRSMQPIESDSDSDSDESSVSSEMSEMSENTEVPSEFEEIIQRIKELIYKDTVLRPTNESTAEAQDNQLLQEYLSQMATFYQLTRCVQEGDSISLGKVSESFSSPVAERIHDVLSWLHPFFKRNGPSETAPYEYFLERTLYVYPFVMNQEADEDVEEADEDIEDVEEAAAENAVEDV